MKRLLDTDVETGTEEYIHLDGTGKAVIESIQDCEPVLDYNAAMAKGHDKKSNWWHVGSVPLSMCVAWATESGTRMFSREWQAFV